MNVKKSIFSILLISLFLLVSYDRLHQWDGVYYLYEAAFVPVSEYDNFLTAKYGHLLLMKAFISLTGTGLDALSYLDLIYALMVLSFVFVAFKLLKELLDGENDAVCAAIILMFLPLTLYLSFKTLSEVPALLLSALGILSFYLGLKEEHRYRALFFISCSGILLFFATVCRSDASIMFFSFVLALIVIYGSEFGLKKLFSSLAVVCTIFSLLLVISILLSNTDIFSYYFSDAHRSAQYYESIPARLFRTGLEGALFCLLLIPSLLGYREKRFRFALIWFISASIPVWIMSNHIETRFLYHNLIPLSILIFIGFSMVFDRMSEIVNKKTAKIGVVTVFAGILIGNVFFVEFMETELDESAYTRLFEEIDALYDDKIILIPYAFVDYSFLKFAFPDEEIFTVQNIENTEEERELMEEEYGDGYLGDTVSLEQFNETTVLYISWRSRRDYLLFKDEEYGTYNYSWVTRDPQIELTKVLEEGHIRRIRYEAYSVRIT